MNNRKINIEIKLLSFSNENYYYHPYVDPSTSGEQMEPEVYALHAVLHEAPEAPRIHFLELTIVRSPRKNIQIVFNILLI